MSNPHSNGKRRRRPATEVNKNQVFLGREIAPIQSKFKHNENFPHVALNKFHDAAKRPMVRRPRSHHQTYLRRLCLFFITNFLQHANLSPRHILFHSRHDKKHPSPYQRCSPRLQAQSSQPTLPAIASPNRGRPRPQRHSVLHGQARRLRLQGTEGKEDPIRKNEQISRHVGSYYCTSW